MRGPRGGRRRRCAAHLRPQEAGHGRGGAELAFLGLAARPAADTVAFGRPSHDEDDVLDRIGMAAASQRSADQITFSLWVGNGAIACPKFTRRLLPSCFCDTRSISEMPLTP